MMPFSPLTRWLLAGAAMLFPCVLVTMMEPDSWLAPGSLGIAMSLWVAGLFRMVREAAAFDATAFHLTRPNGRWLAFRRLSRVMLGMVVFVAALAALRGWYYHLGWRATVAGFGIAFSLIGLITVWVATGVQLSLRGRTATRWVGLLMGGLPVGVLVVLHEMGRAGFSPGADAFGAITARWSLPVWIALGICFIGWWLAAGRGRWWPALVTGCVAGLAGSMASWSVFAGTTGGSARFAYPALEMAEGIRLKRTVGGIQVIPDDAGNRVVMDFSRALEVEGLGENEYLYGQLRFPFKGARPDQKRNEWDFWRSHLSMEVPRQGAELDDGAGSQESARILSRQLPLRPKLKSGVGDFRARASVPAGSWSEVRTELTDGEWHFSGQVHQVSHQAAIPLMAGGRAGLSGFGHADFEGGFLLYKSWQMRGLLVLPGDLDPLVEFIAVVVSRSGRETELSRVWTRLSWRRGLGSHWGRVRMEFPESVISDWSDVEREGAVVHLFKVRKTRQVEATLPLVISD
jgi:hypothetical protein